MDTYYKINGERLTAIADAIRGKTGGTAKLTLDEMAEEIRGISGGSGVNQEKTFVVNGVYLPDEGYTGFSKVTVDVTEGSVPPTGTEVLF